LFCKSARRIDDLLSPVLSVTLRALASVVVVLQEYEED